MDGLWHDSFYWKIREAVVFDSPCWEELKNVIDARRQGYKNITDVVNYQSNHDHDRLLVELGKRNLYSYYIFMQKMHYILGKERQIFDKEAFRRVRMAFAIQATSYGLMMIWMGEEIGEYKEKTPGVAKLDWSLIEIVKIIPMLLIKNSYNIIKMLFIYENRIQL